MRALSILFAGLLLGWTLLLPAFASERPWEDAAALSATVHADLKSDGLLALEQHVPAIEAALDTAAALFAAPISDGAQTIVLTDGSAETLFALAAAAKSDGGDVIAVGNPYPLLALYLGSFYVETGRPEDAVKVLSQGLNLSPVPSALMGATVPDLLAEQGVALARLSRWTESLATYDRGLLLSGLGDTMRAVLLRGRGFALVELKRLDEAQSAYQESLRLDPADRIAPGELDYIARLRAGMAPTEPQITLTTPDKTPKTKA